MPVYRRSSKARRVPWKGPLDLPRIARMKIAGADFNPGSWCSTIDVRDFIVCNVTPYDGDEKFLVAPTQRTKAVWEKLQPYFKEEQKTGVLAVDAKTPSTLLAHKAGYIDRDNEVIVGLQTDQPFKRAIFPYGGLRMVEAGLKAAGFEADPQVHDSIHPLSQDPQRRGLRCLHARDHEMPQVRHHHRAAGCLWSRQDHRRLPPRRALRHRRACSKPSMRSGPRSTTCGRPTK